MGPPKPDHFLGIFLMVHSLVFLGGPKLLFLMGNTTKDSPFAYGALRSKSAWVEDEKMFREQVVRCCNLKFLKGGNLTY